MTVYRAEYYQENRGKILEQRKKYYTVNREKILSQKKIYADSHKERKAVYMKKYSKEHLEERKLYNKQYRIKNLCAIQKREKLWYNNNVTKKQRYILNWQSNNMDKVREYSKKQFARRKRNLQWILMFPNPFDDSVLVDYHHITDAYVVAIPRELHKLYCGKNHREKVMGIVKQIYLRDDIK